MTQAEQAVLIWSVLVLAAQIQRVLTYAELEGFTGIVAQGQSKALGLIHAYGDRKHYPPLNSIVVLADTGFPGDGFPTKMTKVEILVEHARVFAFGWSGKDKPRSQDFEASPPATA